MFEKYETICSGWEGSLQDFLPLLEKMGFKFLQFGKTSYYRNESPFFMIDNNTLIEDRAIVDEYQNKTYRRNQLNTSNVFVIPSEGWSINNSSLVGFFDEEGYLYTTKIIVNFKEKNEGYRYQRYDINEINKIIIEKPKKMNKKLVLLDQILNEKSELYNIVHDISPWGYKFLQNCDIQNPEIYLMAPYIETIYKANFTFMKQFLEKYSNKDKGNYYNRCSQEDLDKINRLCQPGKNPKEIFKCPEVLYNLLKNETDMSLWDTYRKLVKFDRIDHNTLEQVYYEHYSVRDLNSINSILNKTYENKNVFTWNTLLNYLHRIDMYEAIPKEEGLEILGDYLLMCNQLNMRPKIDGDSLKREHDIAARLCRLNRDKMTNENIIKVANNLAKYNYTQNEYFIRAITSQEDLIKEATQQHNCVAGYAKSISEGKSLIFVMRRVDHPESSLVTVELSSDHKTIRQKYLAYNKPIYDKSITDFLEDWIKYVKNIDIKEEK